MFRAVAILPLVVVMLGLLGCGGGNGVVAPAGPTPHPDNATVAGRVVAADDVELGLSRAIVSEATTGMSTETDGNGVFVLTGLPAGAIQIEAEVPRSPDYDSATVSVPTGVGQVTNVNIAVLPATVGTPTALLINPVAPIVEAGGTVTFGASVYVGMGKVDVEPTWVLSGDNIGAIAADGTLVTTTPGSGLITATAAGLIKSTGVIVTGPLPPDISSVLVSASVDVPIPASGGPLDVTAVISDGDGVANVTVEIYLPDGSLALPAAALTAGTPADGTWSVTYAIPANDNAPGPDGTQAPQLYSLRVRAQDAAAAIAYSDFYDFVVAGLDVPPPPA